MVYKIERSEAERAQRFSVSIRRSAVCGRAWKVLFSSLHPFFRSSTGRLPAHKTTLPKKKEDMQRGHELPVSNRRVDTCWWKRLASFSSLPGFFPSSVRLRISRWCIRWKEERQQGHNAITAYIKSEHGQTMPNCGFISLCVCTMRPHRPIIQPIAPYVLP